MVKSSKLSKVVLFDIDYTLFDTELFRDKIYRSILSTTNSFNTENKLNLDKIYKEIVAKNGYFSPRDFLYETNKILPTELGKIEKAIWDKNNFAGNIYGEVKQVIENLSKIAIVGIFSKGFSRKWQISKIAEIVYMLSKSHIHITLNKHTTLPKIVAKYRGKRVYLIDDALDVLYLAKRLTKEIFTIWVMRGKYAQVQKKIAGFEPDATVDDLKGIVKIVTS